MILLNTERIDSALIGTFPAVWDKSNYVFRYIYHFLPDSSTFLYKDYT